MPTLVLYQFDQCPFCVRVTSYLRRRGIVVPIQNTMTDRGARQELIEIGGSSQVPCLIIDGDPLYESEDIIDWFDENVPD